MQNNFLTPPNIISMLRLTGIPIAWLFVYMNKPVWVGLAAFILYSSDALDGYLARRLNMVTKFGSRLDSISDSILNISALTWLMILRPETFSKLVIAFFAVDIFIALTAIILMYIKFHRFPMNLHLYSSKIAAFFGVIFIVETLIFGLYPFVFYLAAGFFIASNLEAIWLIFKSNEVSENMKSIFFKK